MKYKKVILAIETTCDETAIAIMADHQLLSSVVASQIKDHQAAGGVIPELAARLHYQNIDKVLRTCLSEANCQLSDLTHVAYCSHPGLLPALHIGAITAKTIASYFQLPWLGFNHLHAHIYSCNMDQDFQFPLAACVFSGGHCNLFYCEKPFDFQVLLATNDDAIGECLDKIAVAMGYQYPGGPVIEKLAKYSDASIKLPVLSKIANPYFSFSGIKSYVINLLRKNKNTDLGALSASLQNTLFTYCYKMIKYHLAKVSFKSLALCGGVAANKQLRTFLVHLAKEKNVNLYLAPLQYCCDNAAMLANLSSYYWD